MIVEPGGGAGDPPTPPTPFLPPPGIYEPGDPNTSPTARDTATPLAARRAAPTENTPKTHRGPRPTTFEDQASPSLDDLRRHKPPAPPPTGLWASLKRWLGL